MTENETSVVAAVGADSVPPTKKIHNPQLQKYGRSASVNRVAAARIKWFLFTIYGVSTKDENFLEDIGEYKFGTKERRNAAEVVDFFGDFKTISILMKNAS